VEEIVNQLGRSPWGLHKEMTQMLLGALLFNGYLIFVRNGGARLHSSDVAPMVKGGLDFFNDIRYLERDKDIDVEALAAIFALLGLQSGLVRDKDSRSEAVKVLRLKGIDLKGQLSQLRQSLQVIVADAVNFPDLPWLAFQEVQARLAGLDAPVAAFAEASKVADLGKIDSTPEFRASLKGRLADLDALAGFVLDWNEEKGLKSGLSRMLQAIVVLPKISSFASSAEITSISDLERIAGDSKVIYSDAKQLLDASLRRPLKGKLEQFRQKYDQLYYGLHQRTVGAEAPWGNLTGIRQSNRFGGLTQLKQLPFISSAPFNQIALEIAGLERKRCNEFSASTLAGYASCPYCRFPEDGQAVTDLPARIADLKKRLDGLWDAWGTQILSELPGLKGRLALLSPGHEREIAELELAGKLPEPLTPELLAALYELTSDLQAVEVDVDEWSQFLIGRGSALTEDEMRTALDEYLMVLLRGHDRALVRFKVVHKE
jgi:hypothetical protein